MTTAAAPVLQTVTPADSVDARLCHISPRQFTPEANPTMDAKAAVAAILYARA